METSTVSAVLFVKDLQRVAAFYAGALGLPCSVSDANLAVFTCGDFKLVVHQIRQQIAGNIKVEQPPVRRVGAAVRLDFPVLNIAESRRMARALGGDIDEMPPPWEDPKANFFLAYDPEGNQIGVRHSVTAS